MKNIFKYLFGLWGFTILILLILFFGTLSYLLSILLIKNHRIHYLLLHFFAKLYLMFCNLKVSIEGTENIPKDKNFILISNYQSDIQHMAFTAYFPRRFRFVMSDVLARSPFFGHMSKSAGHIPIADLLLDKPSPWKRSYGVEKAIHYLKNGEVIFILPEGRISLTGKMNTFHPGVVIMAHEANLPIIPCAITGAHEIAPPPDYSKVRDIKGNLPKIFFTWVSHFIKTLRSGKIKIKIGSPVYIKDVTSPEVEADKLKRIIQNLMG